MFWIPFIVLFALAGLACYGRYRHLTKKGKQNTGWGGATSCCCIIIFFFLVIPFFCTAVSWYNQLEDFENVKMFKQLEKVYWDKADALTTQFASYLAEAYPQHEKDIFKNISPGKVGIYLVKYPELQASRTMTLLVENISKLQNDRYGQQVQREQALRDIRFRPQNPCVISWLIPRMPPEK